MNEKFLPIGTVCLLKGSPKKIAIAGFCMKNENNPNKIYDYVACYYPEGIFDQNKNILFDHDQIESIVYMGFVNDEEKEFKNKVKELLASQEETNNQYDPSVYDMNTPVASFIYDE